jgi:hypothetical protein
LARKTDRSKVDALETEKAQFAAQVVAMTRELTQKSEESGGIKRSRIWC